jgi:uncharacterized protein YkwD
MKFFQSGAAAANPPEDPYYAARLEVVRQINRDRTAAGLEPVEFDPLSSQVCDLHCQEMAGHRYLSHWNLQGLLPYHRYHFAGGRDHLQENLSRMTILSSNPAPISTEPSELLPHMLNAHQRFVEETPPLDGHRKNVLDPGHTHVGIGLAVVGGEFTLGEEFVHRYVTLSPLPEPLPRGSIRVEGQTLRGEFGPYYCALFYEGWPQQRTVEELNRTYAYEDMSGDICGRVPPWQMSFDRSSGRFRFSVPVEPRGPGLYHLVMWVRRPHRAIPYTLSGPGGYQVDTKDGVPCAGWVFRSQP